MADNLYSQVTGKSNSRSSSSSGYSSRSDSGSGIPRSKARVDSEVQLIQSAITNLKVTRNIYKYSEGFFSQIESVFENKTSKIKPSQSAASRRLSFFDFLYFISMQMFCTFGFLSRYW